MNNKKVNTGAGLLSNAVWQGLPATYNVIITFFLTPFILGHISTEHYGIWRLSFSILTASWILQIGLNSAVSMEVSRCMVKKDYNRICEVVSTSLFFYVLVCFVIFAAAGVLVMFFPRLFHVSEASSGVSKYVIGLVGAGFGIWMPLVIFRAVLNGLQIFFILGITEIIVNTLYAGAVVTALNLGAGVVSITVLSIIKLIVPVMVFSIAAKRSCPQLKISFDYSSYKVFKSMLGYSVNSLVYTIANTIFCQSGIWLSGLLLGTAMTAYYSTYYQLTAILGGILAVAMTVAKPAATTYHAQNDAGKLQKLFMISSRLIFIISIPMAIFISVFRRDIINVWIGKEDFVLYSSVVPFLAAAQVFWLVQQSNYYIINGIGRHGPVSIMAAVSAAAGIILSVILCKTTSMGLTAIALGISLPTAVISLVFIPIFCCMVLEIKYLAYIRQTIIKIIPSVLLYLILCLAIKSYFIKLNLLGLFCSFAISGFVMTSAYLILVPASYEKQAAAGLYNKISVSLRNLYNRQ